MTSTLLIVQIVLSIAITISVLLQKSSSIGLGAYSGSNESMFGAKGPMGFLAKVTFTLALLFILNTLALGYFYTKENKSSVVDTVESVVPVSPEKTTAAPVAPSAPTTKSTESVPATPVAQEESKRAVEKKETTPKSEDVAPKATN
jgi:preprotein translocase subunit SecG